MSDHAMGHIEPLLLRDHPHQHLFDFDCILVVCPTETLCKPFDMGVYNEALCGPKSVAQDHIGRFSVQHLGWRQSLPSLASQGGKQLRRPELVPVLKQAGIATDDAQRVTHLMMRAELDGIVCSGGRRSKQFTYALLPLG